MSEEKLNELMKLLKEQENYYDNGRDTVLRHNLKTCAEDLAQWLKADLEELLENIALFTTLLLEYAWRASEGGLASFFNDYADSLEQLKKRVIAYEQAKQKANST